MNQAEFADIGGVQKRAQINYEKGERFPDVIYLTAVACAGADVLYLITGKRSQAVPEAATLGTQQRALLNSFEMCTPAAQKQLLQLAALLAAGLPTGSGNVSQTIKAPVFGGIAGGNINRK